MPIIRLATINIYRDQSRWPERRALLVRELAAIGLDLIALQEVTNPLGASTAHWLARQLGGYDVRIGSKTGRERNIGRDRRPQSLADGSPRTHRPREPAKGRPDRPSASQWE